MSATAEPIIRETKRAITKTLRRATLHVVDAGSTTTGKDFLLKVWSFAVSCPIGIAIVHEEISPDTIANIYYELGLMQAYGRETVVIKIGYPKLPSDLVRTEYISADARLERNLRKFVTSLARRAEYYKQLASLLEANPLLAMDYLRRAYLLNGDVRLKRRVKEIFAASGFAARAPDSVERLMVKL